jgi:hypothetical protein
MDEMPVDDTPSTPRPTEFRMAFQSKAGHPGVASIFVASFGREHIPFLMKALRVADDILALDDEEPSAAALSETAS